MNYYKRNLGDFARDLTHLSQGAIGAYDLLIDWYYANEKPLPADPDDIYNITRSKTKDEKRNAAKARAFFDADGRHTRCDDDIAKYRAQAESNRAVAVAREEQKRSTNGARIVHESLDECSTIRDGEPSHKPLKEPNQKPSQKKEHASPGGSRLPEDFPSAVEMDWARNERPSINLTLELQKFRDHWLGKAGKDGRKADWPATWRNWVRNSWATPGTVNAKPVIGKTMQAMQTLQGMKDVNKRSDSGPNPALDLPRLGRTAAG